MEQWRFIKDNGETNFNYQVSDKGNVKSLINDGLLLKTRVNSWGYEIVNLKLKDVTKTKQIHRLVAESFLGWREPKWQVNHIDGNKLNNELSNLEWLTAKQNRQHAVNNGLIASGKRLTEREKNAIMHLVHVESMTYQSVASAFNISRRTVARIINLEDKRLKNVVTKGGTA
ncbi:HNH endonuclease domain protein [Enterococcus faecium 13.SD.W.09]|nr:HNH endonuclease domain protein [Enterococcus faecium 13.SD.W.09]